MATTKTLPFATSEGNQNNSNSQLNSAADHTPWRVTHRVPTALDRNPRFLASLEGQELPLFETGFRLNMAQGVALACVASLGLWWIIIGFFRLAGR